VDEEVEIMQRELYLRSAMIEGNSIPEWDILDTQPFHLNT
jgi:hypothetical protein